MSPQKIENIFFRLLKNNYRNYF